MSDHDRNYTDHIYSRYPRPENIRETLAALPPVPRPRPGIGAVVAMVAVVNETILAACYLIAGAPYKLRAKLSEGDPLEVRQVLRGMLYHTRARAPAEP